MPPAAVAPAFFSPAVRAQTTALACRLAEQVDVPLARWSCAELAAALISLGIVVGIAASTVWRWLQAEHIKPWRFRMWQQVRDPQFLPHAREILSRYVQERAIIQRGYWDAHIAPNQRRSFSLWVDRVKVVAAIRNVTAHQAHVGTEDFQHLTTLYFGSSKHGFGVLGGLLLAWRTTP